MPASPSRFLAVSVALHGVAFAAVAAALPRATVPCEVSLGVRWAEGPVSRAADPAPSAAPAREADEREMATRVATEIEFEECVVVDARTFVAGVASGPDDDAPGPFGLDARFTADANVRFGGESRTVGTREAAANPPEGDDACGADVPSPPGPPARSAHAKILETVAPAYPETARVAGAEGVVVLDGEVLADGCVGEVTVVRSSGSSVLDRAALAAVRRWRFAAAVEEGVAVRSVLRLPPIRFRLD